MVRVSSVKPIDGNAALAIYKGEAKNKIGVQERKQVKDGFKHYVVEGVGQTHLREALTEMTASLGIQGGHFVLHHLGPGLRFLVASQTPLRYLRNNAGSSKFAEEFLNRALEIEKNQPRGEINVDEVLDPAGATAEGGEVNPSACEPDCANCEVERVVADAAIPEDLPVEPFGVTCDETNNTPEDLAAGKVMVDVEFPILKGPAIQGVQRLDTSFAELRMFQEEIRRKSENGDVFVLPTHDTVTMRLQPDQIETPITIKSPLILPMTEHRPGNEIDGKTVLPPELLGEEPEEEHNCAFCGGGHKTPKGLDWIAEQLKKPVSELTLDDLLDNVDKIPPMKVVKMPEASPIDRLIAATLRKIGLPEDLFDQGAPGYLRDNGGRVVGIGGFTSRSPMSMIDRAIARLGQKINEVMSADTAGILGFIRLTQSIEEKFGVDLGPNEIIAAEGNIAKAFVAKRDNVSLSEVTADAEKEANTAITKMILDAPGADENLRKLLGRIEQDTGIALTREDIETTHGDIHGAWAAKYRGISYSDVTPEHRMHAKSALFGAVYRNDPNDSPFRRYTTESRREDFMRRINDAFTRSQEPRPEFKWPSTGRSLHMGPFLGEYQYSKNPSTGRMVSAPNVQNIPIPKDRAADNEEVPEPPKWSPFWSSKTERARRKCFERDVVRQLMKIRPNTTEQQARVMLNAQSDAVRKRVPGPIASPETLRQQVEKMASWLYAMNE